MAQYGDSLPATRPKLVGEFELCGRAEPLPALRCAIGSSISALLHHPVGHYLGLARAQVTITLANMVYNMGRLRWLLSRSVPA